MQLNFDHGPLGTGTCFAQPIALLRADTLDEVVPVLHAAQDAQKDGHWLAGFLSYEAGYAFVDRLRKVAPKPGDTPLVQFGVYAKPVVHEMAHPAAASLQPLQPVWSRAQYAPAFDAIKANIAAGECYQINLTFPLTSQLRGQPAMLANHLARTAPLQHGVTVQWDDMCIISRSPELFFETDAKGMIRTRPMKGTRPRGQDAPQDALQRADLLASEKDRAENLMIVDLLRNDLSRVSVIGSVRVPDLFRIETYPTVHQMVSTIEARLRPGTTLCDIFEALFPCGSITGAPKIRAMQIIRDLEPMPREIYCGTIGWIAPDGRSSFNVAIRTLTCRGPQVTLNVGGGIVHDSAVDDEYDEAVWKTLFLEAVTE
ncbi:aminodeoxychorismate synthase, component I [Thioclava sp. SK-1]|uniref:aminodeoxychorismate synthase component I n=1 Tax=Thioclava sp. SK-1 TaxID=1889770 RepID=UPI00082463F1|nr:aminodeoxychorismate synthase component I [Thioclava sp. SK-1]OCX65743.1 aminodeoxychorismate synthase, component I [Thioclava sp. SK-1]